MKARFMNLHRLVKWADKILKHSVKGPAEKGSLLEKLRASLYNLPECEAFITCFIRDTEPLMACQRIIKNNGLNLGCLNRPNTHSHFLDQEYLATAHIHHGLQQKNIGPFPGKCLWPKSGVF
jgi:hypothetical protein